MNKKILAAFITVVLLSVSCGGEKVEKVELPNPNNTTNQSAPTGSNKQIQNSNQESDKSASNSKPEGQSNLQDSTDTIPEAIVEPMKESQLLTTMRLIPKEAFDISTTEGMAALIYANQESCFKRMKYDFKTNVEDIAKTAPIFFYDIVKSPRNDFENPKNWIWTVTNITQLTYWMAGNFNLNINMPPILKKEKYKSYPLEYQYSYYLAPEDVENPRYGRFASLLADSLVMLSDNDVASLARNTIVNIAEKGSGMLDNPDYAKLLGYLGEPEACSLVKVEKPMDIEKMLADPNAQKMPEELRKTFEIIENKSRPKSLKYIGIGFYPEEEYNLRFLLFYDSNHEAKNDMTVLKSIWSDPSIVKTETWRNMTNLEQTRFSVKDNIGIVECKTNGKLSGIDVITNVSVVVMTNSLSSLIKR